MASFNSIPPLHNGATANTADALGLNAAGQPMGMGMGMGLGDPFSFDEALLDVNSDLHAGLPFTPSAYDFDNFTFDDPFSATTSSYPPLPGHSLSQGHNHSHGSHTVYNLPSVGGGGHGPIVSVGGSINEADSPPDLLDNKLLGFSPPIPSAQATLIDSETGRFADLNMTAELYGMFFVAEDVFSGNTPDQGQSGQSQAQHSGAARPLELTCYRRNLWQCTGQITLPRHALHCSLLLADDNGGDGNGGRQVQIKELWASLTAVESIEGKQTEIISIPWKSSTSNPALAGAGGQQAQQQQQQQQQQQEEPSKTATTPPKQLLDLSAGQEIDGSGNRVSIPVSWKRLQFKHATANNGRRKGLQQHYVVQINLLAKTSENGEKLVKLAEIQSGPVIVRGRSPRNFDSRRDVPLTGDRKGMGMLQRTSTEGSVGGGVGGNGNGKQQQQQQQQQQQSMDRSDMLQRWNSLGNQQSDWPPSTTPTPQLFSTSPNPHQQQQHQQHPNKRLAMSVSPNPGPGSRPPIPSWGSSSSDVNNGSRKTLTSSATPTGRRGHHRSTSSTTSIPNIPIPTAGALPISLSLSEDEMMRSPPLNLNRTNSGSSQLYPKSGGGGGGGLKKESAFGMGVGGGGDGGDGGVGLGLGSGPGSGSGSATHTKSDSLNQQSQRDNNNVGSPSLEAADLLYEYFPLSLDDWLVFLFFFSSLFPPLTFIPRFLFLLLLLLLLIHPHHPHHTTLLQNLKLKS
ncbi:hypothetical protein QBC32DRAFT_387071 [Pseudoneurospora amorphoporcata]|uniref:NDT80 domain-containing protein n=1 Tax=Pseudoneurospora amorphoporcata TaxID=241081 RepID=A0AAN6NX48_9PEZI|nr:hypothetical protein QBC32DRAFT_387071 [Pseudoneurospora amorphoporcata]